MRKTRLSQWDLLRQKRTAAIKDLQQKGFIQIDTDNDSGRQVLIFPWTPDQKIPYKQLSAKQRLINEVSAGAFGEIAKDSLLHWVDTLKTRKQAEKRNILQIQNTSVLLTPQSLSTSSSSSSFANSDSAKFTHAAAALTANIEEDGGNRNLILSKLLDFKSLYAGFPIVALASIPQGGSFFLFKKGVLELQREFLPQLGNTNLLISICSISAGVMAYWLFRTPAELIKTQIQTRQEASVLSFFTKLLQPPLLSSSTTEKKDVSSEENYQKIFNLWKYYPVMLSLDIPFQIINFILFGLVNDYLQSQHIFQTIWIRLIVGIGCGMIAAFVTCPLDVGKTRILARDKGRQKLLELQQQRVKEESLKTEEEKSEEKASLDSNMVKEVTSIFQSEGLPSLFLGIRQRLLYTGLANGIRLAAYGSSRMDLMMRALDEL